MESQDITHLEEQLKRKQLLLKGLDENLARELTRKQLLEEIYGSDSSIGDSSSSISKLSDSAVSQSSISDASISSSFLRKEITNVHQFMRQRAQGRSVNKTQIDNREIDRTKKPEQADEKYHHTITRTKNGEETNDYSAFLKKTTKNEQATLKFIREDQWRTMKYNEEVDKNKEIMQFIEQNQRRRKEQIDEERKKVREELLKQQSMNQSHIAQKRNQKSVYLGIDRQFPQSNILKTERKNAFTHLLKSVQRGKRNTDNLLDRTRIFTHQSSLRTHNQWSNSYI